MKQNLPAQISALAVAVAMGTAVTVQADTFDGTTTGTFINPVAIPANNPTPVDAGAGTSTFTFGTPDGTGPNSLNFAGVTFAGEQANSLFNIGTLTYFNGTTVIGTSVDTVTLDVKAAFTAPNGITEDFDFPLGITVTPNTGNANADADFITLPSVSSTTFTVGAETYTLGVEFGNFTGGGFLQDGNFHVYEGDTATAPVEGIITTNLNFTAPDSASTMMLLGGISSVLFYARRKLS